MGAAKFPEEIIERYIEDSHSAELPPPTSHTTAVAVKPSLKYCPLCYEGYLEDSALDNHIASRHGKQHVYLTLNEQVVRDVCWIKGTINRCEVVVLKVPLVEVNLTVNGRCRSLAVTETTDLTGHLAKGSLNSTIKVEIRNGLSTREFAIYQGKQPSFRSERIDQSFGSMMRNLLAGESVDLTAFRDTCTRFKLNDLETRYLNGIVEYCHGLTLEREKKQALARARLESAMDLLIPFRTPLAEDLRHALALRMNCFSGQWGCSDGSPFQFAEQFFCSIAGDVAVMDEPQHSDRMRIAIDQVSSLILEALKCYDEGDDEGVFRILATVEVRDRNDEDKVRLIEARTRARGNDLARATAAYQYFRDHPVFGQEAEEHLRCVGQV